jgi:branched-chain amino acid transport system substrate-binding protein
MGFSHKKRSAIVVSVLAMGLVLAACGSSSSTSTTTTTSSSSTTSGSSSGGNGAPIKIALITSQTGADASSDALAPSGFLARIDAQNAEGGVNGHKIDPIVIDDQTSPTQDVTAIQQAISDGVTGIVANSPLFFEGAKYAQQAGIPVTGNAGDGTEWGTQPYTNMFPSDANNTDPKSPWTKLEGDLFKKYGGTVLGTYGYGISPSSTNATYASAKSALAAGLKVGVMDTSVQFGSESFGTEALAAKSAGVNAYTAQMDINSDIALLQAMNQNGVHPKATIFATGYDDSLPGSNVWSTVQGAYFATSARPWNITPNAGVTAQMAAFKKYAGFKAGDFPNYAQEESWLGADLMILGLQKAGANPTSASTIKALRSTTDYNANGLLAVTLNYSENFGYNTKTECLWLEKAGSTTFNAVSATPSCAQYVPGSTSLTPPKI